MRRIRTDDVRYPGLAAGSLDWRDQTQPLGQERPSLGPVRDTGLAVGEGRRVREGVRRRRVRRQRLAAIAVIVTFGALLLFEFVSAYSANAPKARAKIIAETTPKIALAGTVQIIATHPGPTFSAPAPKPTPVFAHWQGLQLHLPIPTADLTELGFHQASYSYALHMKTGLPNASMAKAFGHGTRKYTSSPVDDNGQLDVSVLRMWRPARPGKPDSAADVGALPGTPILSPVDGTVVKVKPYKLYGKWFDYEIHIRPTGFSQVDVVLIHVDHVTAKVGDSVLGGVTPLGKVRKLSDKVKDQLAEYLAPGKAKGDHVHIQLNNVNDPIYHGLDGVTD